MSYYDQKKTSQSSLKKQHKTTLVNELERLQKALNKKNKQLRKCDRVLRNRKLVDSPAARLDEEKSAAPATATTNSVLPSDVDRIDEHVGHELFKTNIAVVSNTCNLPGDISHADPVHNINQIPPSCATEHNFLLNAFESPLPTSNNTHTDLECVQPDYFNQDIDQFPSNNSASAKSVTFRAGSPDIFLFAQQDDLEYNVPKEEDNRKFESQQGEIICSVTHQGIIQPCTSDFDTCDNKVISGSLFDDCNKYIHSFSPHDDSVRNKNCKGTLKNGKNENSNNVLEENITHNTNKICEQFHMPNDVEKHFSCKNTNDEIDKSKLLLTDNIHSSLESSCLSPIPSLQNPFIGPVAFTVRNTETSVSGNESEDTLFEDDDSQFSYIEYRANSIKSIANDYPVNDYECKEIEVEVRSLMENDSSLILSCSMLSIANSCFILLVDVEYMHIWQCTNASSADHWTKIGCQAYNWFHLDTEAMVSCGMVNRDVNSDASNGDVSCRFVVMCRHTVSHKWHVVLVECYFDNAKLPNMEIMTTTVALHHQASVAAVILPCCSTGPWSLLTAAPSQTGSELGVLQLERVFRERWRRRELLADVISLRTRSGRTITALATLLPDGEEGVVVCLTASYLFVLDTKLDLVLLEVSTAASPTVGVQQTAEGEALEKALQSCAFLRQGPQHTGVVSSLLSTVRTESSLVGMSCFLGTCRVWRCSPLLGVPALQYTPHIARVGCGEVMCGALVAGAGDVVWWLMLTRTGCAVHAALPAALIR